MKCPVCRSAALATHDLDGAPLLTSDHCPQCHGDFIRIERYLNYLAGHPADAGAAAEDVPVADTQVPKICPVCRHFMTRRRVGHGTDVALDHCATCGGIWLDAGEWTRLRTHGLHTQLHKVASDVWQAQINAEARQAARAAIMAEHIGAKDFAEVERVRNWLLAHPRRPELLAWLLDDLT